MPEEGLMFTYRLMPPHATGTGGGGLLFGVCRGMPEEGLMFTYRLMPLMRQGQEEGAEPGWGLCSTYRLMPSCDRDRRRGIAVLGCVGVCQRRERAVTVKARRGQGLP